eukprot:CAMPEP_0177792060 /NCGR_PEP_ID=MMETSP0491_2-20121128/24306_1 /TAXON_ID=63592 /ORGANISM="Tetraselmis chuii, Strain PLY429" /LENGTH=157 /DNA_ID=CAMNT_0019314415 /DNA_START=178 /DNA_END=651 /DNA_ORIENTATION=-
MACRWVTVAGPSCCGALPHPSAPIVSRRNTAARRKAGAVSSQRSGAAGGQGARAAFPPPGRRLLITHAGPEIVNITSDSSATQNIIVFGAVASAIAFSLAVALKGEPELCEGCEGTGGAKCFGCGGTGRLEIARDTNVGEVLWVRWDGAVGNCAGHK